MLRADGFSVERGQQCTDCYKRWQLGVSGIECQKEGRPGEVSRAGVGERVRKERSRAFPSQPSQSIYNNRLCCLRPLKLLAASCIAFEITKAWL